MRAVLPLGSEPATEQSSFTSMLHKQHGKEKLMVRYYIRYSSEGTTSWISLLVKSKDGVDFAMLFTLRESRKTPDPVLSRVRGSRLQRHP